MADSLLENYNPLYDVHLRQYFALPHMQKHLRRMGLLDSNGVPVSQNGNVESELYARHHAMMDMMLRNRERVLMQLADLQKKYDAAEKVEIYRRVRSGVTDAEEFRRNHLSRSLSRPRRSATQPVKTSGRRRHSSNSFEDTEVIKRIENTYEQPQTPQANIKNTYDRLSANTFKYQFLHKLDDTTLINYKDSLQKQLQKLKRFRDISFGPHNVARHQTSQPASWFFRRRSLPSLSNSAPQNSLHSPIRSLKAAKDAHEKSSNGTAVSTADENRRRQGKSQSPRRHLQNDRPRQPRRTASPTKRAATTHAGTRLPPINNKETPPKPPRVQVQRRTAPTPEQKEEEEKPTGLLGKIAGGVAAAAAVVGGTVAAAIGVSDNEEEKPKAETEEMDTTEDEAPKTPSPPRTPEVSVSSPVPVEHEESAPSPVSSPVHIEQDETIFSPHHTEVESPIPSPRHEEFQHKTPSPVDVHVTEASPRQSPTEEEEPQEEASIPTTPKHEEGQYTSPAPPESQDSESNVVHSQPASPQHEEIQHRTPSPEQHAEHSPPKTPEHEEIHHRSTTPPISHREQHSPAHSPQHEEIHAKTPSPVESYREQHEEHVEHQFSHREASPQGHGDYEDTHHNASPEEEERTASPNEHTPSRFDAVHEQKAHSFHEDDLRSIEKMEDVSHDIEVEDTQNARNKRGASFEAEEVLQREAEERAEEFNGVQDQSNGAGAELEHNQEEVEKLTDDHEGDGNHGDKSDSESLRSHHEEATGYTSDQRSFASGDEHHHEHKEASPRASETHSPVHHEEHHEEHFEAEHHQRDASPVSQHGLEHQSQVNNAEDVSSLHHEVDTHQHDIEETESHHNDDFGHESHVDIDHENYQQNENVEHHNNNESDRDQHDRQSDYAESHEDTNERSIDVITNQMEQSIYQQHDDQENEVADSMPHHVIHQAEEPLSPPGSPKELLSPESPIQKAQDVMVNSFYPGADHDEPPHLPTPDPHESVEERSHEEHVERDPIQAHDQAFEPGFISSSTHGVEEHHYNQHHEDNDEPQQYNGIQDDENLEPPISNRSLESFQRHEEEVAADIEHDHDISSYNDNVADLEGGHDIYIENRENIENESIAPRGQLLNQPSIEITAPSDFGDVQVDEISAPPTPNSPHSNPTNVQSYDHQVIDHPVHQREVDVSDEEANENSGLLANGHEGDHEDQDEEDDDDDTGSVVMHKTPDSANYQQHHHQQQYQRSDDEQSETGHGHL